MTPARWDSARSAIEIHFADGEIDAMVQQRELAGRRETGGILIGLYLKDRSIASIEETRGTRTSRGWFARFRRGIGSLQQYLDEQWDSHRRYYVGEWHSHPAGSPIPSAQDDRQMQKIAADDRYQCPEPIMVIVGEGPTISVHLYVADGRVEFSPMDSQDINYLTAPGDT